MREESNSTPFKTVSARQFPSLSLLIVVCDRKKNAKIVKCFKDQSASLNLMTLGKGTANSKILNYLGLGQTEKAVLWSILPADAVRNTLAELDAAIDLEKPGHGVAFTLPLDGVCVNKNVKDLDAPEGPKEPGSGGSSESGEGKNAENKDGGNQVARQYEHELILAIINRGYNQEVMDAARTAKATGGTIIHARGFVLSTVEKFFGVTIQPEKEIILILAQSERKQDIMRAIAEKAGRETPAEAITFSLPVTDVLGLQPYLPEAGDAEDKGDAD